jgi:hypothetical protein
VLLESWIQLLLLSLLSEVSSEEIVWFLLTWIVVAWYLTALQSQIKNTLAKNIAKTVLPLGLPIISLPAFIGALATGDEAALVKIPGVSLHILGAAVLELKQTYAATFRLNYLCLETFGEWSANAFYQYHLVCGYGCGSSCHSIDVSHENVRPLMDDHLAVVGMEESSLFRGRKSKNRSEA